MNLTAVGNENIILNGNPKKTYFKATYNKHTNFGLQRFRIDFEGSRVLNFTTPTIMDFKIPRYADLLMDTNIVINLPDIWSPIWEPNNLNDYTWSPYDFKWIENLGTQIIQEIEITCGANTLQKYSGQYLDAMVKRDFSKQKLELFNTMSGNIPALNDPFISEKNFSKANLSATLELNSGSPPSIFFSSWY